MSTGLASGTRVACGAAALPAGLVLRRLATEDLPELIALHADLHRAAPTQGLFVRESPAFFARHLGPCGQILGLRSPDGALVAYSVLGLPEPGAPDNFGHDLRLAPACMAELCHLDGTGVHPNWRGRHLQRWLTAERLRLGAAAGRRIALSTVSPRNQLSLSNLVAEGLDVVALIAKYGELRFVLRRDAGHCPTPPATRSCRVPLAETPSRHCALLTAGWRGSAVDGAALIYHPRPGGAGR